MLGSIINAGIIISLFAIAAPFIFVLLVIKIVTGSHRRDRRRERHRRTTADDDAETMNEMSRGMRDLKRRIDNLETLKNRNKDKER